MSRMEKQTLEILNHPGLTVSMHRGAGDQTEICLSLSRPISVSVCLSLIRKSHEYHVIRSILKSNNEVTQYASN